MVRHTPVAAHAFFNTRNLRNRRLPDHGQIPGQSRREAFKETIEELKESGKKQVVIDLSKADFMDSSGIGTLIGAFTSMKKVDGDVKLAGMKERIKNLFLLTRLLGPVFEEYDTVDEAIASMQ